MRVCGGGGLGDEYGGGVRVRGGEEGERGQERERGGGQQRDNCSDIR